MKTKPIPGIIMLLAGVITSVIVLLESYDFLESLKVLLISMLCFYSIGFIIKIILDKNVYYKKEELELEEVLEEDVNLDSIHTKDELE